MLHILSYESLYEYIKRLDLQSKKGPSLILIGGCSRTGKSTLAYKLSEQIKSWGIESNILSLDSWLISIDKRKKDSTVMDRYDCNSIVISIKTLLKGNRIFPPVYNVVSRRRLAEKSKIPIVARSGVVIIDGVNSLALKELLKIAILKIFTTIPDEIRLERLMDFYVNIKGFNNNKAMNIISSREKEEVLFIKKTADNADLIFTGNY